MRVLHYVHIQPRTPITLDDQGLNPAPGDAVSLTGQFGASGLLSYNGVNVPHTSWTPTQIDLVWPEIPFDLPESNWQSTGYDTDYLLAVIGIGGNASRQVQTQKRSSDFLFTVSSVSPTGIFANDTNVDAGDTCLLRTESGTLISGATDGDLTTSLPYTARYQIWDGSSWAAEEAMVTIS